LKTRSIFLKAPILKKDLETLPKKKTDAWNDVVTLQGQIASGQ